MSTTHESRFNDWPIFPDREEAGRRLAEALTTYKETGAVVLGIPRGGVTVAAEVADALNAELDVIVARKIGAPAHEELAIGAVTAGGGLILDDEAVRELRVPEAYLHATIAREHAEARRREERFRDGRAPVSLDGKTVLIVDDGLATGATMRAAIAAVQKQQPAKIVVAVPVGSVPAIASLSADADEVVALLTPEPFWAVGYYYGHFEPVEDDAVRRALARRRPGQAGSNEDDHPLDAE